MMKAYEIVSGGGIDALKLADRPTPEPGHGEVARGLPFPRIPNSDGAGEVIGVGPGVTRFKVGDRVASCFFQRWEDGEITADGMASALGGAMDGVLAEEVVLSERAVVAISDHMSFVEAATLPCAALTAWHGIVEKGGLKAGDTVLCIGTGGVSIFGLQIARMTGARAVVISSSDAKLERAKALGAWGTVNYRTTPDWEKGVLEATGGKGVDHVLEVGGAGTLPRSIASTRISGHLALIGVLTGGEISPALIFRNSLRVSGIYVGSRAMFERMNRAFTAAELRPVIDKTFAFREAREAFHYLKAAGHFGKVVVKI
jgi:NADPH:quinone reductase-like Zn-dependent oxidoreductase